MTHATCSLHLQLQAADFPYRSNFSDLPYCNASSEGQDWCVPVSLVPPSVASQGGARFRVCTPQPLGLPPAASLPPCLHPPPHARRWNYPYKTRTMNRPYYQAPCVNFDEKEVVYPADEVGACSVTARSCCVCWWPATLLSLALLHCHRTLVANPTTGCFANPAEQRHVHYHPPVREHSQQTLKWVLHRSPRLFPCVPTLHLPSFMLLRPNAARPLPRVPALCL